MCPNCSVALTVHRRWRAARCHYCDYTDSAAAGLHRVPRGGADRVGRRDRAARGAAAPALSGARVARMDRDTTRRKGSQQTLLGDWHAGRFDILIGTQMITKGHDVPGVTLVGVVARRRRSELSRLPRRRAHVPTARAGRGPRRTRRQAGAGDRADAPAGALRLLQAARDARLRRASLPPSWRRGASSATRRSRGLHPVCAVRAPDGGRRSRRCAADAARRLRAGADGRFGVLGPAPARDRARCASAHRHHILVRSPSGALIRQVVGDVLPEPRAAARSKDIRVIVDVDPRNTCKVARRFPAPNRRSLPPWRRAHAPPAMVSVPFHRACADRRPGNRWRSMPGAAGAETGDMRSARWLWLGAGPFPAGPARRRGRDRAWRRGAAPAPVITTR